MEKEEHGEDARRQSLSKVRVAEQRFIAQVNDLVRNKLEPGGFYSKTDVLARLHILEDVIESKEGSLAFYVNGEAVQRESDLQIACRLIWAAAGVHKEPSAAVTFKLASNSKLAHFLKKNHPEGDSAIVIFSFGDADYERAHKILRGQGLLRSKRIIAINCESSQKTVPADDEISVLFIAAGTGGLPIVRLGTEERLIREAHEKRRAPWRLDTRQDATIDTFRRALLGDDYHIVHISGHANDDGLVFGDGNGGSQVVPVDVLSSLFSDITEEADGCLMCVILNSCSSLATGIVASASVPFTIAMDGPIDDAGALLFSQGFYDALGAGRSVPDAYHHGCRNVDLKADGSQFRAKLLPRRTGPGQ